MTGSRPRFLFFPIGVLVRAGCRSATPYDDAPPPPPRDGSSLPERRPPDPSTGSTPHPYEPPASLRPAPSKPACPGGQAGAPGPTPFRPTWAGHRWRPQTPRVPLAKQRKLGLARGARSDSSVHASPKFNCKQHGRRKVPTGFDGQAEQQDRVRPCLLAHNLMASDECVQKSEVEDVRFGVLLSELVEVLANSNGMVVSLRVCVFSWYFTWARWACFFSGTFQKS
uniref:Uncharacterized protein n=1 Tax=Setaria viridis TaxID=4556 RepID=A0A4U6UUK2_SETVI|nr:hypothetical protein SEVIR_5G193400v2 [Setaria viridis]